MGIQSGDDVGHPLPGIEQLCDPAPDPRGMRMRGLDACVLRRQHSRPRDPAALRVVLRPVDLTPSGVGGDGRTATLHSFSGSMYEQVEIIAGQTPDKRADSLGGQLNLKTRSPLAMSERRRVSYTAATRYFPSWSKRNFEVSQRPWRPDLTASYTEVFSVGKGSRNLGVAVTASYQEVLNPHDWDILLYESTTNPVAQLRDYTRMSGLNDRFLSAVSARADYKWSESTRVSLRFLYNAGSEPFFSYTAVNPWIASNLTVNDPVTNPNGGIRAGYTAQRIEMLPVNNTTLQPGGVAVGASQVRINPQRYSFTSKNPTGTLVFEHNWGRWKVDHAYRWSNTHWDSGAGRERENGTVAMRTQGPVGFVLDYSNPFGQTFVQTGGASVYDASSYRPFVTAAASAAQPVPQTSTVFNKRDTVTDTNEVTATVNGKALGRNAAADLRARAEELAGALRRIDITMRRARTQHAVDLGLELF